MKQVYRLKLLFVLLLLFAQQQVNAQALSLTGKVIDETGMPLPNATLALSNGRSTKTDMDGKYRFNGLSSGVIIVRASFVGYEQIAKELNLKVSASLDIQLKPTASNLADVVVVGYGTQQKKDLTGSVAVISSKDFQKGSITTPDQMLAGKVPGLAITSNSGQPGAGSTIRIRGGSSLNASNDPLIVIDGVPLENASISGASNPLSFINPNDISSFTVLKDASAAAIYGARAANGVIMITTKKGQGGDFKLGFTSINSASEIAKKVDVLNANQIRDIVTTHGTDAQKAMLGTSNTDWQNLIYQTGYGSDNNLTFSGGVKALPYRMSLGYQNQSGVLRTDKLQKVSGALVLNPTFFDNHLKVDLNLKGSIQKSRFANQSAIGAAVSFDPSQPVFTNRPDYNGYWEWLDPSNPSGLVNLVGRNPLGLLMQREDRSTPRRSIGNLQLDYKFHFLPELRANVNLGYDVAEGKGTVFVDPFAAEQINREGVNTQYRQTRRNTVFEFYLNYAKDLREIKSRIDLTAGYSYNDYLSKFYNFADYDAYGNKIAGSDPAFPYDKPQNRLISFFGRLNYNFDDRYLLTATLRRDGSSRFGDDNKWGMFPSVALAWTVKNESFLKDIAALSTMKVRAGYGITGQQDGIGNYSYLAYYGLSNANASYQFGDYYYQMYRPSAYINDIKWEQTATTNLGVDFGFLNNRISGSFDWYYKNTTDLLNKVPQPAGTNFNATAIVNVGSMKNEGVEMVLNFIPIEKSVFGWDFSLNATYNKNTITNLTVVPDDPNYKGFPGGSIAGGTGGQNAFINAVGGPKNTFYLYQQVYDANNNPVEGVYVDVNKDGTISDNDFTKGHQADPRWFLGFTNNLSYKNWSLNFTLRANLGNYVYNNTASQTGNLTQIIGTPVLLNSSPSYLKTGFAGQQLLSDYYVENASFLRMDNVNLSYRFGKIFNNKCDLQLNASVQNVFVITKYSGLDPEIASGIDNNLYPRPRVMSLGLNLNF